MKRIIPLLLIVLAVNCHAQCGYPYIGGGGSGVGAIDSAILGSLPSTCTACATQSRACWEMPDSFNGDFYVFSPNVGDTFSAQIIRDCRYLMFDTCSVLPFDASTGNFVIRFLLLGTVQVCISGQSGDTVFIVSKSTPSPQEELSVVLADLDSCGGATSVLEPLNPIYEYYRWSDGVHMYPPLVPGFYWRRYVTNPRNSRIIRVY